MKRPSMLAPALSRLAALLTGRPAPVRDRDDDDDDLPRPNATVPTRLPFRRVRLPALSLGLPVFA